MRPFDYQSTDGVEAAVAAIAQPKPAPAVSAPTEGATFLGGGTNLLDLMKLQVIRPDRLVAVDAALPHDVKLDGGTLTIGAGCRMSDVAEHESVRKYPMLWQSLALAASPQIRNMASIGGNLLQRTRCPYFRDTSYPCNKREPGTGCPAIGGDHRLLAILGTSDQCIANFPGDFAVACVALDASVALKSSKGERTVKLRDFYKKPGSTPNVENDLRPGELITSLIIPVDTAAARSHYAKLRDRASYAFALASAAIGITLDGDTINAAHVALGGIGAVPWHSPEAERALVGKPANEQTFQAAADAALADAKPLERNAFKVALAKRAIVSTLARLTASGPVSATELWHLQHGR